MVSPEKLTEVIDIYENSQMYLPDKYSKFSDTGSAKPGDKFVKQTLSQNMGNSQNSAAYPRWKTGRSSQANGTPSRCWLCGEIGHRAVHCKKRTQVSSSQEKRGASGKPAAGVNNVKAEPAQCNRVAIEARNQSGTNLVNRIDFSIKVGVAFSSQNAFLDKMDLANCKQPLQLSELQYCNVLMKTQCGVKTVRCLKDSGAVRFLLFKEISLKTWMLKFWAL